MVSGTDSTNFPGTTGGAQTANGGQRDAWVARLSADLTSLLQATYFGGTLDDTTCNFTLSPSGDHVYVAGSTNSTNLPGTTGGAQALSGAGVDAYVVKLTGDFTTRVQATYLAGIGNDVARGIAVHPTTGDVYVTGETNSTTSRARRVGLNPRRRRSSTDTWRG